MKNLEDFKNEKGVFKWKVGDYTGATEAYKSHDNEFVYFLSGRRVFLAKLNVYLDFIPEGIVSDGTEPLIEDAEVVAAKQVKEFADNIASKAPTHIKTPIVDTISDKRLGQFQKLLTLDINNEETTNIDFKIQVPSERTKIMLDMLDLDWKLFLKKVVVEKIEEIINEL